MDVKDNDGDTPLLLACERGFGDEYLKIVEWLVDIKKDSLKAKNYERKSPLDVARRDDIKDPFGVAWTLRYTLRCLLPEPKWKLNF